MRPRRWLDKIPPVMYGVRNEVIRAGKADESERCRERQSVCMTNRRRISISAYRTQTLSSSNRDIIRRSLWINRCPTVDVTVRLLSCHGYCLRRRVVAPDEAVVEVRSRRNDVTTSWPVVWRRPIKSRRTTAETGVAGAGQTRTPAVQTSPSSAAAAAAWWAAAGLVDWSSDGCDGERGVCPRIRRRSARTPRTAPFRLRPYISHRDIISSGLVNRFLPDHHIYHRWLWGLFLPRCRRWTRRFRFWRHRVVAWNFVEVATTSPRDLRATCQTGTETGAQPTGGVSLS